MLEDEIGSALAVRTCRTELWAVDQLDGPQVRFATLAALQAIRTPGERALLLARWRRMAPYLDQHVANLRTGLDRGYDAARINVERVIGQLDRIAAQRPDSSSFYAPARRIEGKDPAFAKALLAIVRESVLPAFRRYRDFLSAGYLPRSRPEAGIRWLPNGVACYAICCSSKWSMRRLMRRYRVPDMVP